MNGRMPTHGGALMICGPRFESGTTVPLHSHPHEQVSYILSGKFESAIVDRILTISAGDKTYKQPGIFHGARCLSSGELLDIFSPMCEDFFSAGS